MASRSKASHAAYSVAMGVVRPDALVAWHLLQGAPWREQTPCPKAGFGRADRTHAPRRHREARRVRAAHGAPSALRRAKAPAQGRAARVGEDSEQCCALSTAPVVGRVLPGRARRRGRRARKPQRHRRVPPRPRGRRVIPDMASRTSESLDCSGTSSSSSRQHVCGTIRAAQHVCGTKHAAHRARRRAP